MNVGTASARRYIACSAPECAPIHNPHDKEHFGHFYASPPESTKATFEVIEAAFPTRFRSIIDTPGVIDDAYRSDFERAVQIIERQRDEIERLEKREAYLVAELNCLGGMDLNGDKDGLE